MITAMWVGHSDRSRTLAIIVRDSLAACGWKHEYAAALMRLTPPQLTRQLAGLEHLSVWRLADLPDEFHAEYDKRRAALRGAVVLEAPDLSLIRGASALGEKRMASFVTPYTGAGAGERQQG